MTRDDIIKLAREAGFTQEDHHAIYANLVYLAELAAAAEREACADILDRNCDKCDPHSIAYEVLDSNAKAIRARGQQ